MSALRGKTRTLAMASMTNHQIAEAVQSGADPHLLATQLGTSIHGIRRRLNDSGYNLNGEPMSFQPTRPENIFDLGDRDFSWQENAACKDRDPALWDVESDADHDEGRAICQTCPVRERCLTAALEEEQGQRLSATIRGALDPEQRHALLSGKPMPDRNKCKNGHTRTPDNTYKHARGYKRCRDCDREQQAARRNGAAA